VGAPEALSRACPAVLAGLALGVAAVDAAERPYAVTGGCRDGVPNGAYELRGDDGRLRVAGAYARGRRTGTFVFWSASGDRVAVIPYDDDAKTGTVALWYGPVAPGGAPRRRLESAYAGGALHGVTRSWYADGRPRAEYLYERGVLAEASAWSEAGAALGADDARRGAARDRAAEAAEYAALERLVAEHAPRCD